jgi:Tfp pilus assembly protein PilF
MSLAQLPSARVASVALLAVAALSTACAPTVPAKPAAPAPTLAELMQRPAERALVEGIRHYDEGQYALAETQLRKALATGLADGRDRASAHKLLAFITCTSERLADCAVEFAAARAADPHFQLSRSESGHPVWGPVYRRVLAP